MKLSRLFLGWDKPFINSVTNELLRRAERCRPCDLSAYLVIVPTVEAGRLLRAALAAATSESGGLLSPHTATPPQLFIKPAPDALSATECLAIWLKVLTVLNPADFVDVLPHAVTHQNDELWRLAAAEHLQMLRGELTKEGRKLAEIATVLGELESTTRWRQLAELEERYLREVAVSANGRPDPFQSQLRNAASPELPFGIERLIIAGCPDPLPPAVGAWQTLAEIHPTEVWINAPESHAEYFDGWGRPLPDAWRNEIINPEKNRLCLLLKPSDQATELAKLTKAARMAGATAVGVLDREILPHAEEFIERECGIKVFNPTTQPLANHPICRLALSLLRLHAEPTYAATAELLRHDDVIDALRRTGVIRSCSRFLEELDKVQNDRLPEDFKSLCEAAREYRKFDETASELLAACERVETWLKSLKEDAVAALPGLLRTIYAERELALDDEYAGSFGQAAEAVLAAINEAEAAGKFIPASDAMKIKWLERILRIGALYPENSGAELDLSGWLELGWKAEPHLIIAGFNEERVTDTVVGDPFLPDGAREHLRMTGNRERFTRDLFLFQALCQARRQNGSISILLGKMSERGDALKPSRLLFRCGDDELPDLVNRLFADRERLPLPDKSRTAAAVKLSPRIVLAAPKNLRVTGLRDYLTCPFRFYLKQILRMEHLDDRMVEIEAKDFGSMCHQVLERYGREFEPEATVINEKKIAEYCLSQLELIFRQRFGRRFSAALLVQYDMLRLRLEYFAKVQAEEYRFGRRIWKTEEKLSLSWRDIYHHILPDDDRETWRNEIMLTGKIDRLDLLHTQEGRRYRLIDYKTSGKSPQETHFKGINEKQWIDLQLPLYAVMASLAFPEMAGEFPQIAYFCLPDVMTDTEIKPFAELDETMMQDAVAKADEAIHGIVSGDFTPTAGTVKYDDFEELFGGIDFNSLIAEDWPEELRRTWRITGGPPHE